MTHSRLLASLLGLAVVSTLTLTPSVARTEETAVLAFLEARLVTMRTKLEAA